MARSGVWTRATGTDRFEWLPRGRWDEWFDWNGSRLRFDCAAWDRHNGWFDCIHWNGSAGRRHPGWQSGWARRATARKFG